MNFNDLYKKIAQLDETGITSPTDTALMGEEGMDECGDMMPRPVSAPKQQDNVTMNVSMNGSGAGGIKDLMQILRNIEQGGGSDEPHNHDALFGNGEEGEVDEEFGGFDNASTTPDTVTLDINAITPTGNDLASKGAEAEKVNGGGNPFNVDEGLLSHLTTLYQEVKSR